jgi:hypothetical protein
VREREREEVDKSHMCNQTHKVSSSVIPGEMQLQWCITFQCDKCVQNTF